MFRNINQSQNNAIKEKLIVLYDKATKRIALSIRNQLNASEYSCTIWNEKQYRDNEPRLTNGNRFVVFSENLFEELLSTPSLVDEEYVDGVIKRQEGATVGFKFDYASAPKNVSEALKGVDTKTFLAPLVAPLVAQPVGTGIAAVGGIVAAPIIGSALATLLIWWKMLANKSKIKFIVMNQAKDKFLKEDIAKFAGGK